LSVQQGDSAIAFLPKVWPNVKAQMQIVFDTYDVDGDGVFRVGQGNTYDSTMLGPNTFIGSYYVTALRACSKMAVLMDDPALAKIYGDKADISSANYEKLCWKEDFGYYIADVTIKNCQFSYGPGCFIDQLCGSGLAFATGLGYLFNEEHEKSARAQIAKNNTVVCPPFKDFQKHMFPGDTATTTCTYPHGKLGKGMQYDTLVSIGWTYPVIAGMLHDNNIADATTMNDTLRQRQDGRNRSPWNEPECDTHYSRMMSSWGLYDQACGLRYDSTCGFIAFAPRFSQDDFQCFFAADGGWGQYSQKGPAGLGLTSGTVTLSALHGTFALQSLALAVKATSCKVTVGTTAIAATVGQVGGELMIVLTTKVVLKQGDVLTVQLKSSTGLA